MALTAAHKQKFKENFENMKMFSVDGHWVPLSNGSIRVKGDCRLHLDIKLSQLPVKFEEITGSFICENNGLTTLLGFPLETDMIDVRGNILNNLDGLPVLCNSVFCTHTAPLPLLKLLTIKNLEILLITESDDRYVPEEPLNTILMKYLRSGHAGLMPCAAELIKAGYKGNARL